MSSCFYSHDFARTLYSCKFVTSLLNWVQHSTRVQIILNQTRLEEEVLTDADIFFGEIKNRFVFLSILIFLNNCKIDVFQVQQLWALKRISKRKPGQRGIWRPDADKQVQDLALWGFCPVQSFGMWVQPFVRTLHELRDELRGRALKGRMLGLYRWRRTKLARRVFGM